jgi:anti-anti-sigma regulatory factor
MLRITPHEDRGVLRLQVEGQLNGPWVAELETACTKALASESPLELDLSEVRYADHAGARLLADLKGRGVTLREPSAFLREQIRRQAPTCFTGRCASG